MMLGICTGMHVVCCETVTDTTRIVANDTYLKITRFFNRIKGKEAAEKNT